MLTALPGTRQARFVLLASLTLPVAAAAAPSDYVNTLRGTSHVDGSGKVLAGSDYSRGNTVPAATMPFGFNFWTPVTGLNYSGWPYIYSDKSIVGFACSHQPSAWAGDYANFQVVPELGSAIVTDEATRAVTFSHDNETARAHYYSVKLDNGLQIELAPTDHASAWRFTYPKSAPSAFLLFDTGDPDIKIDTAAKTVSGSFYKKNGAQCDKSPCNKLYFYATFSKAGAAATLLAGGGGYLQFTTAADEAVTMSLATSFISVAQAQSNLTQEIANKSFDEVKADAAAAWDALLGKVTLTGASDDQLTTFYSSLYRAFVYPNARWENVVGVGPRYFSPYSSQVVDGKMYVNNGLWDTYRATRPLTVLLAPGKTAEILDGFVNAYKEGGWAPRWSGAGYRNSMLGTHSDIVFADAFVKGIENFDTATAYESMLKNATVISSLGYAGRQCLERSTFLRYCPVETESHSAAWSIEDDVNDYALSLMAKKLGKSAEATYFQNRALGYVNLFSPEAAETLPNAAVSRGFFRGKKLDGTWRTTDQAFQAREWGYEWIEGNSWHYITAAAHDPLGMGNLYGRISGQIKDARSALVDKIDDVFLADRNYLPGDYGGTIHEMREGYDLNRGQYVHSNQPVHLMLYEYNYAGAPAKTAERIRDLLASFFDSGLLPNQGGWGYRGDEDGGEQSSFYVFSVLGFFPTAPGHSEYAIGSPPYTSASLTLENGKVFSVTTLNNSDTNKYVQSAKLNGAVFTNNYLTHEQILAGGTLELTMGPSPSKWGTAPADTPPSITSGTARIAVPMETKELGGTVTASSPGTGATDMTKAVDGDGSTLWQASSVAPSITYQFPSQHQYTARQYTLTSGDTAARDPKSWTLSGSNDGTTFTPLDQKTGEAFAWRRQTKVYGLDNVTPYAYYRLEITKNGGDAATELAELDFICDSPVTPLSATSDAVSCADASDDASNAIDGAGKTKWCSAAAQAAQWLVLDLGAVRPVQQFRVKHAGFAGEDASLNTKAFDISLSQDNTTWAPAVHVTDNTASVTQHTIAPTDARYVKLAPAASKQAGAGHARIYELEVYAPTQCSPESDADFCTRLGKTCGTVMDVDNCGSPRTVLSCGMCPGDGGAGPDGAAGVGGTEGPGDPSLGGTGGATSTSGGASGTAGAAGAKDNGGCGCRVGPESRGGAELAGLGALLVAAALRRCRRKAGAPAA